MQFVVVKRENCQKQNISILRLKLKTTWENRKTELQYSLNRAHTSAKAW